MKPNEKLKARIILAGFQQKDVAGLLGITELKMSQLVTGRVRPTDDEKTRLAEILDCKVDEIFSVF